MTVIEIIDTFTFYGLDVIALAVATVLLVQLLKFTLFKKCQKKVLTFLPFAVGCLLYAVYAAVRNLSLYYVVQNYVAIIEHGFAVGALSTVVYVWYEQFIRNKKTASATEGVIATLIEGFVPDGKEQELAEEIALALSRDVTGDGANKIAQILSANVDEAVDEKEVTMLARLIIETLARLSIK